MNTAYLVLENGKIFKGKQFGAAHDVIGEIVFTTGMTGYIETLTDRSYYGQIIVQTFPLIGNYGIIPADFESDQVSATAYIVKDQCQVPSNFRSEGDIDAFLKAQNVVGLCGIDTRTLTKIIRENGVMNGMITTNPDNVSFDDIKNYKVVNAVKSVSTKKSYTEKSEMHKYKVALIDYGLKQNIVRELVNRGCDVTVFSHDVSSDEIINFAPDGIMLSNGPGDPADNPTCIETLKKLMKASLPIFGICLGHQLLALASGFSTEKLKYGHRGANQPAKDTTTNKVYITSQNHGYAVVSKTIDKKIAKEIFVNGNDGTCEGIEYTTCPVFSVQFHPEACGGPKDSAFLFDKFIDNIKKYSKGEK